MPHSDNEKLDFRGPEGQIDANRGVEPVGAPAIAETAEMHDKIERAMPSESIGENASEDFGGGAVTSGDSGDAASTGDIKASLKALPSEKVMKKEVVHSIEKRISHLRRDAARMRLPFFKFDAARYQKIVAEIRHLVQVLASMTYATYESIKSLWLEHVGKKA